MGAGPNGLAAAITLARAGLAVGVYEAAGRVGGGATTEELTLPGFRHDPCSAVHPLAVGSPFLRSLALDVEWVEPELPLAQTLAGGGAAVLARSPEETAAALGDDGAAYRRMLAPFLGRWDDLIGDILRPMFASLPSRPFLMARFGLQALLPAQVLARRFREPPARALLAGMAAHGIAPLGSPTTAGLALMFALAGHEVGWPFPRGGSQSLSDAMADHLGGLGGEIVTDHRVASLDELPAARAYVLDVSVTDLVKIAGDRLGARYVRRLGHYQSGPAVFKVDYALSGPVPWTAEACRRAGTVHVGASMEEIGSALITVRRGQAPDPPFLITAQPSVFDPTRAPAGQHVLWVYAHVPNRWRGDLTGAIERQLDRFAPGFRDLVLARCVATPADVEARNPNCVGGDIAGGRFSGRQAVARPVLARVPYATPDPSVFLCSSSTPPGPGVHGMCGWHAARVALRRVFGMGMT